MKVKYTIKDDNGNVTVPELTFQELSSEQLEYIRKNLHGVMDYNSLFSKEERDEIGDQNLINQVAAHLKK